MTPHPLDCTVPHWHATDDERRACEVEHAALMFRLNTYAA